MFNSEWSGMVDVAAKCSYISINIMLIEQYILLFILSGYLDSSRLQI